MSKLVVETVEFSAEQGSDPSFPAANKAIMFTKDNGSGRTQVGIRFSNGSTVILGTQNKSDSKCSQTFRGLSLRTHPDSGNSNTQIMLVQADEIVLNDGESIASANNLVFNKTITSTAGGMQAAAANSTWNKLYYIRSSNTGAAGLWGVRAKDYFNDTSFTTTADAARALRLSTSTATDKLAQGFQLTTAGKVELVDVIIDKTNSPTGNYWFTIEADSAGNPSGTPLATSDKYDVSRLTSAQPYVRFPFRNPATLSSATQYHLVLQGDYTKSDTVVARWMGLAAGGYASGSAKQFNGATWGAATGVGDFNFRVYVTRNDTAISLPSGYDQYAHVGWFYINGSGIIKPFAQRDRKIITGNGPNWKVGGTPTGTGFIFVDHSEFIPPSEVVLSAGVGNTNTSEGMGLAKLYATNAAVSSDIEGQVQGRFVGATDTYPSSLLTSISLEYQAANVIYNNSTPLYWWASIIEW